MTVDIDKDIERPTLIQAKKRVNGKKSNTTGGHVDHIIVIQGVSNMSTKGHCLTDAVGVIEHHKVSGNGYSRSNGVKNHTIMDLPIIPDDDEKCEPSPVHIENKSINERPQTLQKNGYQQLNLNLHSSREIVDLSPIYENSSDACSSHDDIPSSTNEITAQKFSKTYVDDANDSNSATPNSLSQTHSETSLEMGLISESHSKNSGRKSKKKVNIMSDSVEQNDDCIETEASALKCDSEISSPDRSVMSNSTDGYLTMTGTIKRGKKKGQNIDVKLNISREELEILEAAIVAKEISKAQQWFMCTLETGFHIMIWSFLCMPIVILASGIYSFYIGTLTWYNIFTYISEGKNLWKRVFISPFVILLYPFLILLFTVGVGLYAGVAQLTCCGCSWWKEVCDLEKGFYGWFCGMLHLSDCSPYEVVILTDLKVVENTDMRGHSSTEDISI